MSCFLDMTVDHFKDRAMVTATFWARKLSDTFSLQPFPEIQQVVRNEGNGGMGKYSEGARAEALSVFPRVVFEGDCRGFGAGDASSYGEEF